MTFANGFENFRIAPCSFQLLTNLSNDGEVLTHVNREHTFNGVHGVRYGVKTSTENSVQELPDGLNSDLEDNLLRKEAIADIRANSKRLDVRRAHT